MSHVVLFHSALGVRPGIIEAKERLSGAGHTVKVVDQFEGRVFDDYEEGYHYVESIGFPVLMRTALQETSMIPNGFFPIGFSNGAGMAEYVAANRRVAGLVLISGAMPPDVLGVQWPTELPVQIHYSSSDPFLNPVQLNSAIEGLSSLGQSPEVYEYPGSGHLFMDVSLDAEFDADNTTLLWDRVIAFCSAKAPS